MSLERPKIVILAGPTASGKTQLSLELAERFNCEIISADSIQIYKYLNIGSAKPSTWELSQAKHHLIDIRNPDEEYSAGDFAQDAKAVINEISKKNRVPLVVGGTGLYIRVLLGGLAPHPEADQLLRNKMREDESEFPGILYKRLVEFDPEGAEKIDSKNLARIIRKLEIIELTGKKFSEIEKRHAFSDREFDYLYFCLNPDRTELYKRIEKRVDSMINAGLLDEVRSLYEMGYPRHLKSLQSLGYRHAGMVLANEQSLSDAMEEMKRDTRRYAKRQFTWFRSEPEVFMVEPETINGIGLKVANFLGI